MSSDAKMEQLLDYDPTSIFAKVTALGGQADLILEVGKDLSFKVNAGELESHKVSQSRVFGTRVIVDDRIGIAYSESDDADALAMMVEQAIANAKVSKIDPHQQLIERNDWCSVSLDHDRGIYVPESKSDTQLLDALRALEADVLSQDTIESCPYNGLSSSTYGCRIWSSLGLDVQMEESRCSAYAYALAQADGKNAMDGASQVGRQMSDLDLTKLAHEVRSRTTDMLDGTPIHSGRYDVIFSTDCLASLISIFSMAFSGKSAVDMLSPWRDKVGKAVAHSQFSLVDRPDALGLGYTLFDSEGAAAKPTTIVAEGELRTLIHNSVTGKRLGIGSTGHGRRGPKSTLDVSAHQLSVLPGTQTLSQIKAGQTVELTHLTGMHSGANSISGDFSFGASGYLCRDGVRERPIRGVTVAGNYYEILHHLVLADDQHWNSSQSALLPTIRFQNLVISGE